MNENIRPGAVVRGPRIYLTRLIDTAVPRAGIAMAPDRYRVVVNGSECGQTEVVEQGDVVRIEPRVRAPEPPGAPFTYDAANGEA